MHITLYRRANLMENEVKNRRSFDHRHIGVGVVFLSLVIPFDYGDSGLDIIFWGGLFSFPIGEIIQVITTDLAWAVVLFSDYLRILTPHVFLGTSIFSAVSLYNHRSTRVAGIIHAVYFGLVILFSVVSWIFIEYMEMLGFDFFLGGLAGLVFLFPNSATHVQQTTNDQPKKPMNPGSVILSIGMFCLVIWGWGVIQEGLEYNISPIYLMPFLCMVGGPIFIVLLVISLVLNRIKKPKDENP